MFVFMYEPKLKKYMYIVHCRLNNYKYLTVEDHSDTYSIENYSSTIKTGSTLKCYQALALPTHFNYFVAFDISYSKQTFPVFSLTFIGVFGKILMYFLVRAF